MLKDLNRHDIIQLLEENIGKTFSDINGTSVSQGNRNKNKNKTKWGLVKLLSFRTLKETINENNNNNKKTHLQTERKQLQML